MNLLQITQAIEGQEYDFLRENPNLGSNILLLTLGGSHAYGMDKEGSDLDVRGIAANKKSEILLGRDFGQVVDTPTDTTVYSFNKMLELLTANNPNTLEILGCRPEHYLVMTDVGEELLKNRKMFLSQKCVHTFGNYAGSQLRRLENKSARLTSQSENEAHILKSIRNAAYEFRRRYFPTKHDDIKLYVCKSAREGMDSEIFMDVNLSGYPLRDWAGMWNEMKAIVSSYDKLGKRNENAISHDKLGKHMAHLLRLYMMGIDILEKEEIVTYRGKEHDLLMRIRNGEFLNDNRQPISAFYDLVNEHEKRFDYAKEHTALPELPDYRRIDEFRMIVNEGIVREEALYHKKNKVLLGALDKPDAERD